MPNPTMLSRLAIRNFQSLRDVELDLAPFTLVVGRSSSGKSAVVRALRAWARNARGTDFVTTGEKVAVVAVTRTDGVTVLLRKGVGTSEYRVHTPEDEGPDAEPLPGQVYTKCGTSVPDEVLAVQGLVEIEGVLLNVAGQFDPPFLLDTTGSKVAKVFGDLTQVNVIYEAVRLANKRRRGAESDLKAVTADLERLGQEMTAYDDLVDRAEFLERARVLHAEARAAEARASALRTARAALLLNREREDQATAALDRLPVIPDPVHAQERLGRAQALRTALASAQKARQTLQEADSAVLPEIPDLTRVHAVVARSEALRAALEALRTARTAYDDLTAQAARADDAVAAAYKAHADALADAGVCPTCGRATT